MLGLGADNMSFVEKIYNTTLSSGKTLAIYGTIDAPLFLITDVAKLLNKDFEELVEGINEEEKIIKKITYGNENIAYLFVTKYGLLEVLISPDNTLSTKEKKEFISIIKELKLSASHLDYCKCLDDLGILFNAGASVVHRLKSNSENKVTVIVQFLNVCERNINRSISLLEKMK